MARKKIVILYEDKDESERLAAILRDRGVRFELIYLPDFAVEIAPLKLRSRIFYSRVGACCGERDNAVAIPFAQTLLALLEKQGEIVINGARAFALEVNRCAQMMELEKRGIRFPKTIACSGVSAAEDALQIFSAHEAIVVQPARRTSAREPDHVVCANKKEALACTEQLDLDTLFLLREAWDTENWFRLDLIGREVLYMTKFARGAKTLITAAQEEIPAPLFDDFLRKCAEMCRDNHIGACSLDFCLQEGKSICVFDMRVHTTYDAKLESEAAATASKQSRGAVPRGLDMLADYLLFEANQ